MEDTYILLGINDSAKMVYYLSSGSKDKVDRANEVVKSSLLLDRLEVVSLNEDDNILELKEDSIKLYNRFKYLLNEAVSQEDEDEDDLLG